MTIPIVPGLAGLAGLVPNQPGVTWRNRLREAAYNSPKGTRIKFLYEEVSREYELRGFAHEFADVDGAYIQQNGVGPRVYPLRAIFSGRNHDLEATAFEAALLEPGIGKLEHPTYRPVNVIPLGTVARRDDLVRAPNESIVEVAFFTTIGAIYPAAGGNPQNEITAAIAGFDVAASQQFAASTKLTNALQKANLKATIRKTLGNISRALALTTAGIASIAREVYDTQRLINDSLDILVGQPLGLALQVSNLIKAPARAFESLTNRLDSYDRLAKSIIGSVIGQPAATLTAGQRLQSRLDRITNDWQVASHVAMNAVAGGIVAVVADPIGPNGVERSSLRRGAQFQTKPQALQAAVLVNAQFEQLVAWRDEGYAALADVDQMGAYQVDTGEAYQALQRAVALTTGFLIEVSFTLVPERSLVLGRERTIIDLAAELYGKTDNDTLDFLITTNNLPGDHILELPRGRTVLFYP